MTLDANRKNELDQSWMDSLLHEALSPDTGREKDRLQTLFASPAFSSQEPNSTVMQKSGQWTRWVPMALAAAIAVMFGYWTLFSNSDQRAYAAIARSMQPAPVAREYSIRILTHSLSGTEQTKNAQLFLDSGNRFVVHRRGWLGFGDVWFGKDDGNQWVVPRLGPAIVGSERLLSGWMAKKDSTAPYLQIETALKRMEKGYTLRMLPDSNFESASGQIACERVLGTRKKEALGQNENDLPATIELWADKVTGIVHRLTIDWNRIEGDSRPYQWVIELKGFPTLSDDWFKPSGHTTPGQRVVTIGRVSEIDALPKEPE